MEYLRQRHRPMLEEFVTRVRTAIHSPETMRAIEDLIAPHVEAHGPTLAYICRKPLGLAISSPKCKSWKPLAPASAYRRDHRTDGEARH